MHRQAPLFLIACLLGPLSFAQGLPQGLDSAAVPAAEVQDTRTISGRVRLVRPDGVVETQATGFAVLRSRVGSTDAPENVKVPIENGRWSADFPEDSHFQVRVVRIEEGDCYPVALDRWMPLPITGKFDLDVRVLRSFVLRVYGPDGREELQDVEVLRKLSRDARLPHPDLASSKTEVVTAPSKSPVDIRVTTPDKYTYFAKAPGHAWGRIEVDPFLGGVATLQLEAGGTLDIEMSQKGPERGKVFRIRRHVGNQRELYLELKRYGAREVVNGLPEGIYTATSEEPIRPDNMPVYGSQEVTIVGGQTTKSLMTVERNPSFFAAPIAGKLLVPEAWGDLDQFTVVLKRIDRYGVEGRYYEIPGSSLTAAPGKPNTYAWKLAEAMPGGYDLQVRPLSLHLFREVYGGGNLRLDLQLPEPREITLKVVDSRTGEAADVDQLTWAGMAPEVTRSKIKGLPAIECDLVQVSAEEPGQFRFRAPQNRIQLQLDVPEYERSQATLDGTTTSARPWMVKRATGLRLRLLLDGQPVDWKGDAAVASKNGKGQVVGTRRFGDARQYDVSQPGPYVVELPRIPGYGAIPAHTVDLVDGEVLEFDVRLDE